MTAGRRTPRLTSAGREPEFPEAEVPLYAEDYGHKGAVL
jgi:hypothetical protein